jgi:hypothetical protein
MVKPQPAPTGPKVRGRLVAIHARTDRGPVLTAVCGGGDLPMSCVASRSRHPIVFGRCERFTVRPSRKAPQPRLEHTAGISGVRRPPQKSIAVPAYLDQLNQQLACSPTANFDAHDSHGMAAVIRPWRRDIQECVPPVSRTSRRHRAAFTVMQGLDQLVHEW